MELTNEFNLKKIEQSAKDHISKLDLQKMIDDSSDKRDKIMFIEGPPTLNGEPHAGHLRGRVFKDLWYRFNTLNLKNVIFNAGWDTQGLPVELQAEKELGITDGKSGITTQQQIENLVAQCKKIVSKFHQKWIDVDKKLGMSLNQENAYWTYKDEYIEREWQLLKRAHENDILTEGYRVVAYCPSCQTSLSHSEVNQGYEMVQDPSLYYKVKLQDEDVYLVVWTTMPFTLVTDAMVGFNPDEEYVYVSAGNETWIVGKIRLEEFMKEAKVEDYKVLKTVNGSEFEGKKYTHPLLGDISGLEKMSKLENYHIAVAEKFVDVNAGTGIVHLSPANGEDDYNIAMKRKVEIFSPIDDEVKFTEDAGKYAGMFVRDADDKIVQDIKDKNALVRIGKIKHKYPLCWRSHHKLVWLARREYFYMLDRLGDKAIDAAQITKQKVFFGCGTDINSRRWKTILIRTPEDEAAYSSKQSDVVDIIKKIEKNHFGCHITVLTRYKKQADLLKKKFSKSAQNKFQIVSKVVDGKKMLLNSDVFIGSGGTMTAESALLGVPTISYNAIPNRIEDYLVSKKIVTRCMTPNEVNKEITQVFQLTSYRGGGYERTRRLELRNL